MFSSPLTSTLRRSLATSAKPSFTRIPQQTRLFHATTAKMGVTAITSYEQFQEVINGEKPAIIDFWATWCGPCKAISPIFEKISDSPAGEKVNFFKVDVDEQAKIAEEVGVRAMPTFIVFKGGNKVKEVVGANPPALQVSCAGRLHAASSALPFRCLRRELTFASLSFTSSSTLPSLTDCHQRVRCLRISRTTRRD